ncbi:hypothetical protein SAMN05216387_103365 [Nitrosovibrio tenuis]|uniref:Uncharacterized protein n=1 Tax=Nitrosovibrio tenuis TaxID=1233 RepID=A0A1H7KXL0_9PROT|nr:hypothetical protein SAMN05216387_103365 [Nitrosovibrio tenuis]
MAINGTGPQNKLLSNFLSFQSFPRFSVDRFLTLESKKYMMRAVRCP